MQAVVYEKCNSHHALVLREVKKPVPNDNEVFVDISARALEGVAEYVAVTKTRWL